MAPTLFTACNALPPEGAAAPAARRSRFRGPCWQGTAAVSSVAPTLVATRTALPPEGPLRLRPGEAGSAAPAGRGLPRLVLLLPRLPLRVMATFGNP